MEESFKTLEKSWVKVGGLLGVFLDEGPDLLGIDAECGLEAGRVGGIGEETGNNSTEVREWDWVPEKKGEGRNEVDLCDCVGQEISI